MDSVDFPSNNTNEGFEPDENSTPPPFVSWPPPGLEAIHGALGPVIRSLALGGLIVVIPLLSAVTTSQKFWMLGPLGEDWMVLTLTSILGLILLFVAYNHLYNILRTARIGAWGGYGWLTISQVVTDNYRDMGFLIQGARQYTQLSLRMRKSLVVTRIAGSFCYLVAALWLTFGFILAVFLATRGVISPAGVTNMTLIPSGVLLFAAFYSGVRSRVIMVLAKRKSQKVTREEIITQAEQWQAGFANIQTEGAMRQGARSKPGQFKIASVIVTLLGIVLLVSISSFIYINSVIPALMSYAIPRFHSVQSRAERSACYRHYRLEPDPSITATQAGEAIQSLLFIGDSYREDDLRLPPVRSYSQQWLFGRNRSGTLNAHRLLEMPTSELTPHDWEILEKEASNPAHGEFELLSRAASADIFATRWKTPLPDTIARYTMPIPRLFGISDGAKSHLAKAAYEFHTGRAEKAEQTIREIISVGFLLADDGYTLIDNLIGLVAAGTGGEALETYYRMTDRVEEADNIRRQLEEFDSAYRGRGPISTDIQSNLRYIAELVTDESVIRGLRWELMSNITMSAPCMNLNKLVFGAGQDYTDWLASARQSLVTHPGEEELFQIYERGWYSPASKSEWGFSQRFFNFLLGGREDIRGCVELYALTFDELR